MLKRLKTKLHIRTKAQDGYNTVTDSPLSPTTQPPQTPTLLNPRLCKPCKSIFTGLEEGSKMHTHHSSLSSLKNSLAQNCRLCVLICKKLCPGDEFGDLVEEGDVSTFYRFVGRMDRLETHEAPHFGVFLNWREGVDEKGKHGKTQAFFAGEVVDDIKDRWTPEKALSVPEYRSVEGSLEKAAGWFGACRRLHKDRCWTSSAEGHSLPTRLIAIDEPEAGFWKVVETYEAGLFGSTEYASLSHCWGLAPLLTLTEKTVRRMKSGMSVNDLPQTFQDAVITARKLGMKYIWIDSLCILQDSKSDWEKESAKMKDVYLYAAVNIATTAAAQGSEGCFGHRKPNNVELWSTKIEWAGGKECLVLDIDYWSDQLAKEKLNQRAWVVQERMLSPKIVHLGRKQAFWECRVSFACEDWPIGVPPSLNFPMGMAFSNLEMDLAIGHEQELKFATAPDTFSKRYGQGHGAIYTRWMREVVFYTSCGLTNGNDKLIALSGIARLFQEVIGDQYLAGIWKNDLRYELLWRVEVAKLGSKVETRKPSWSWASIDGPVEDVGRTYSSNDDAFFIEIIDAQTVLATSDPTGKVDSGTLTLRGLLIDKAKLQNPEVNLDDVTFEDAIDRLWCLPIRQFTGQWTDAKAQGLILMADPEHEGQFLRVGAFATSSMENFAILGIECLAKDKVGKLLPDVELQTIIIM